MQDSSLEAPRTWRLGLKMNILSFKSFGGSLYAKFVLSLPIILYLYFLPPNCPRKLAHGQR
jgi:hypothetical protein